MIRNFISRFTGYHALIVCAILLFSLGGYAQNITLKADWRPVRNNYEGKSQSLSLLNLTNTSSQDFPLKGWTLYFNYSGSFPKPEDAGLKISYLNGDLYQIVPTDSFKGIAAGATLEYHMVRSGSIDNVTQAPMGMYLVWSDKPDQASPVELTYSEPGKAFMQIMRTTPNNWLNPEVAYSKNVGITTLPSETLPLIIPSPVSYKKLNGNFIIDGKTAIYAESSFGKEAGYLAAELGKILLTKPSISALVPSGPSIVLQKNMQIEKDGYTLNITSKGVVISASTSAGAFYGIQSLKTLIDPLSWKSRQSGVSVPEVEVTDAPRFGYRSFMLDIARNFQPKDEVIKILDVMSLYKLNALHLHFSDDEGWRIEIPSLPELTSVGSVRGHTVDNKTHIQPSFGSGGLTNTSPGSGHYSRKDFIDILKYATERHIIVIPEIESPGHARAAIKAMENRYAKLMKAGKPAEANRYRLAEPADSSKYRSVQGWNDNVINVALPSAYNFMEKVTDEIMLMYKEANAPLKTVHFGGDEVPAGVWERSPAYLNLRKTNPKIQNTDDLWYYYFGKLNDMVKKRGLYVSGWEEAGMRKTKLDGKPFYIANPDFADDHFQLNVWNNTIGSGSEDLAYRLANAGYKVVLSPVSNQYIDMAYNNSYYEPGYKWGGYVDVEKLFYFIPYDFLKNVKEDGQGRPISKIDQTGKIRLTDYGKSNIVGIQGLLWSENNINNEHLEYMLFPKLLALAERAWSKEPQWAIGNDEESADQQYTTSWLEFANVLGRRELPRLTYYNGGYSYRIPEPGVKLENGSVLANAQYPGLEIRYTIDGSEPNSNSKLYTAPVVDKGLIRAALFNIAGRRGRIAEVENR